MGKKIKELTTEELKELLAEVVRTTMEDLMEDLLALASPGYLRSIEEAREDYRKGRVKSLEELSDV